MNDEVTVKQLVNEYHDMSERGMTLKQFISYLEMEHSELIILEFKSRILRTIQ